ncbi:hypothetical protein [Entomobacter blattae]|uniref:Uncharacterized protein n=1 Tax=Entomobacter blattae TaxID=2762277 RepID=A0A7H1NP84_9PROT|nr:hypothetical protein [Entomobacter blattae]QNT77594.1 hypothetical protein JGUZn3_03370 [Entomobacter blattae]
MDIYVEGMGIQSLNPQLVAVSRILFKKNHNGYLSCQREDFLYIQTIFEKLQKWNDLIVICDENEQSNFYWHYRKDTVAFFMQIGFSEKLHEELDYHIRFLSSFLDNQKWSH